MLSLSSRRKLGVASAVFAGLFLVASAASAHVEITPDGSLGTDNVLLTSVSAENECKGAIQTVELAFPDTPDLTVATPGDVTGWTSAVTKRTGSEAAASVVWTNTAAAKEDGKFSLALGPISADQDPIEFKSIVTCADGEVFRWIEKGENSEFPAPVLTLATAGTTDHAHDEATTDTKAAVTTTAKKDDSGLSTGAIVGIVAGALVLVGGGVVLMRRKK